MKVTKKAIKGYFKTKLATNEQWAIRGMLKIWEYQTATEKVTQATREHNDVGFSGCDAEILTSFVDQYSRRGSLSPKQMAIVFKKMPKYWGQLVKLSDLTKIEENIRKEADVAV